MQRSDTFRQPSIELTAFPFKHFHVPRILDAGTEQKLLSQLSNTDCWSLRTEDDFYEVYDLDSSEAGRLSAVAEISSRASRIQFKELMQRVFGVALVGRVEFFTQKMVPGFRNRVHNDWGPRAQTHRLVIQINSGWSAHNGGILMLFDEEHPAEPKSTHRYYLPKSGSAVGFEISRSSFHAVSPVQSGARFTLVFSFFEKGRKRGV